MRYYLTGILSISFALISYSQEMRAVSGTIINAEDKVTPVPFAYVSIKLYRISTVTNEEGKFKLYIPADVNDTLIISCLGFSSVQLALTKQPIQDLSILLPPVSHNINEVTVRPQLSAEEIVRKAINKLKQSITDTGYCLQGYYAEYLKENNTYGRFMEAQVSVYDGGFKKAPPSFYSQEDFQITAARKSPDLIKCFPQFSKINHLDYLFSSNPVRNRKGVLNEKALKQYTFSLDSVFVQDSNYIYSISYFSKTDRGAVWIDSYDYSIIELQKISLPHSIKGATIGPQSIIIKYKRLDSRMYPAYISSSFVIDWKNSNTNEQCTLVIAAEFVTNQVVPYKLPKQNELMSKSKDLYIQQDNPEPEAWKNANVISPTAVQQQAQADLLKPQ